MDGLTPGTLAALVAALDADDTRDEAARKAGVPRRTLFSWLARGKGEEGGAYHDLAVAAKRANDRNLRHRRRMAARSRRRR